MRTVNKVGGANGTIFTEFYGNTTDVKPTENVPNGSAFYEIDNNMQEYRFDKENKIWYPITRGDTAPSGDYLPLSGGIMTGDINMNGNSLLNAKSITLKDETGEYTVALNLVHLEETNPETGEPFSYEAIEFSNSDDTSKQYVITGVADPLSDTDVVNLRYLGNNYIPLTGTKENKPVTGSIVVSSVNGQVMPVIVVNDNTDINKVTSQTLIANDSISIIGHNCVGFKILGSSLGVNGINFYSTDKNDKHDTINIAYNTEYKYLNFDRFTEDKGLIPVLMRGADTPIENNDIPNKKYVDDSISNLSNTYIPLAGTADGNPVTGVVTFNGESTITGVSTPVNDTDVVTKKYADDIKTELDDKTNQINEDLDDITYTDKLDNILEISVYTEGQYYSASSGNIRYNDNFFTVDNYVEVKPSISYVLSEFIDGVFSKLLSAIIIFYDKSKNFLSGGQYSTFTTPEDAKYIRLSLNKDAIGKQLLLEKGTEPTKVWSPYSETRYVKGSKIIDLSYNILKNKPTINGVEVVGEKTLDDYGISSASEIAETYGLYKINEIVVDINGNGDFERLQDAIKSITDNSKNNRYVIYIKEGNYDLAEGITDGENDSAVIGVTIPNWVTLRGLGSRENIILKAKFTNKMQYVSTLNFQETSAIENLTVIGENTKYTIHDDSARKSSGYKRNVKHCIIKGITTYYSTVYGAGTGDGADWEFEDVVFDGSQVGANSKPANTFTVHNTLASQKNRSIVFKNCIFVSANKKNVKFKTLAYRTSTGADNANNMITNVSLYGCKFDGTDEGFELVEENPDVYGKGCYYYVNGYGNINAGYEIITTDGKDYSNRVNLI